MDKLLTILALLKYWSRVPVSTCFAVDLYLWFWVCVLNCQVVSFMPFLIHFEKYHWIFLFIIFGMAGYISFVCIVIVWISYTSSHYIDNVVLYKSHVLHLFYVQGCVLCDCFKILKKVCVTDCISICYVLVYAFFISCTTTKRTKHPYFRPSGVLSFTCSRLDRNK